MEYTHNKPFGASYAPPDEEASALTCSPMAEPPFCAACNRRSGEIFSCSGCHRQMGCMKAGKAKACVQAFLLGNVL